jgi:hypothetical protein
MSSTLNSRQPSSKKINWQARLRHYKKTKRIQAIRKRSAIDDAPVKFKENTFALYKNAKNHMEPKAHCYST